MRIALICTTLLTLTACFDEQSDQSADTSSQSINKAASTESDQKSKKSALTNTPISFAEATGEAIKIIDVAPCPFVSDEKIKASVRTNFDITRYEVSNTGCRWAYNAGFSIEVTIEDIATATPVSKRKYNINVDTVSEPQNGPGTNALVLNDTAWDKLTPFAYSFEQDEKLVFIRYTGFKTNAEIMRPAAYEISQRMGSAVPIESQRRRAINPFKPCKIWNAQDLRNVFGLADTAVISQSPWGTSACSWKIFGDGVIGKKTVKLKIYKTEVGEKAEYEYDSYKPYSDNGETHYFRKDGTEFGMYIHIVTPRPEGLVYVMVVDSKKDQNAVAKVLQKNILSRMVP